MKIASVNVPMPGLPVRTPRAIAERPMIVRDQATLGRARGAETALCRPSRESDVARAARLATAAVDVAGPRVGGLLCEPEFVLVTAGARGQGIMGLWGSEPEDEANVAALQKLVAAEGMVLVRDGETVTLHNPRGYEKISRSTRIAGVPPYDAGCGVAGLEGWRTRALEGLSRARDEGRLPADTLVEHILYGLELGYPDISILDYQRIRFNRTGSFEVRHLRCEGGATSRNGPPGPAFLAEHENHPDIAATRSEWSRVLTGFENDPAQQTRLRDPRYLAARGITGYALDEQTDAFVRVARVADDSSGLEAYTTMGRLPEAHAAGDGQAVAAALAEIRQRCGARLAAAMAQPEVVLALAGLGSAQMTLPRPTDDDVAAFDRANAFLAPRGVRLGIPRDALIDGRLFVSSLQATEWRSAHVEGMPPYRATFGWDESGPEYGKLLEVAAARSSEVDSRNVAASLYDGLPMPVAMAAARPNNDRTNWPSVAATAGRDYGYPDVRLGVPLMLIDDPSVKGWIDDRNRVLRACYESASYRGLAADPAFREARNDLADSMDGFNARVSQLRRVG